MRAVANFVAKNSSLNRKPVVAVPKLLPQQVIGEVSIQKPCPGEIKLTNYSSQVIVRDVVLPRSNYFNAKANVTDGIALSWRVSQFSASATSLSRSCSLGSEFVQFQVGLLGGSPSDGLQKSKLASWLVLNNKFKVSTLTSMLPITVDISQVMFKCCFKVCDSFRRSVVDLTNCQEWRDMPLKLSRKGVRFRQESTIVHMSRSLINCQVSKLC